MNPAPVLDASVLGQLLLMQSVVGNLPDEASVFRFVSRGLGDVPGVAEARVEADPDVAPPEPWVRFGLQAGSFHWGALWLRLDDAPAFRPYEPYLKNFCFMLAVLLEERRQRRLNEEHSAELERRVEERTATLQVARQRAEETSAQLQREMAERVRIERSLRDAESKQRAMIANIADVIAIIDEHGINRYKSPNVERWFGWKPEALLGKSTWDTIHPEDRPGAQAAFAELRRGASRVITGECRYQCQDGTYHWIEYTAVQCFDHPEIRGLLLNYHDISERRRAAEENQKLQLQLAQAQKMESVGRLAGGIAHDFNNLLMVILGNAELALAQVPPSGPAHEALQEIRTTARRSADLTRQLLAFARKQAISPKVLDLNATVEGMLSMLRRLLGECIQLDWRPATSLKPIKIDPVQVDQVLANLALNARDAIDGHGRITIQTDQRLLDQAFCDAHPGTTPGEHVVLAVSDTGCGMSKETLAQIFEPFFTTKGVGAGTGLGLSTVYGIVRQNQGSITVHSEPGHGTTFRLYLPVHAGEARPTAAPPPTPLLPGGHETVLLVEDEPAVLRLTTALLERMGYRVLAAQTPDEALRKTAGHAQPIDLLITDVNMPGMNGRELARRLLLSHPGLKRLYMSGYTADIIARHGVLDEGVNFIEKPFSSRDLALKIREVLASA